MLRCALILLGALGLAAPALAQDYTQPEIGLQRSGPAPALAVRERGSKAMVPLGYVDTTARDFVSTARVPLRGLGAADDFPASTRFTDRLLGSMANRLPGTPSSATLFRGLQDIVDFYAYGGRADGCGLCATHPLSSVTSVNGTSTAGYTLAQWRTFYAACTDSRGRNPVTALSNEVDEIAIQCVINRKTQDGSIWLPSGMMYQTKPIMSGQYALDVRSFGGRTGAHLVQTVAGQDSWHHGTPDTQWVDGGGVPNYFSRFGIFGLNISCGGPGSAQAPLVCGTAIKADFHPQTAGFFLRDVTIAGRGNQTFNYWHDGIACNNCSVTEINNVSAIGINTGAGVGSLLDTGTGLAFTGKGAVQFSIRDLTTSNWNRAVTMTTGSKADGDQFGNQEGFVFDNWQANQVMDALTTYNTPGDGHQSPQFVITHGQFNVCRRLFYLAQVAEVFISNNLVYGCTSGTQTGGSSDYTQYVGSVTGSAGSGSSTVGLTAPAPAGLVPGVPFFGPGISPNTTVAAVSGATITLSKPTQGASSAASFAYGRGTAGFDATEYMVFNGVSRLTLKDNNFALGSSANIATLGRFRSVQDGLIENNKAYLVFNQSLTTGWFNEGSNERLIERDSFFRGAAPFFTAVTGALNGAANDNRFESFYSQYGTVVRSDKSLQFDNSVVVTPDTNKNATLYVPPTFTALPASILITNGDVAASQAFCGVNLPNSSLSGIGITCPGATAGAPIRINYSLNGKQ